MLPSQRSAPKVDPAALARGPERIAAVLPPRDFIRFSLEETEQSLSERFEKQVARSAERIAVKTRRDELTYGQLNALGNRVAHALVTASAQRSAPVAILLEQGAALVGAIVGVLKAGRPYVGLDPTQPTASLRRTLEHCGADLVITNQRNRAVAAALAANGQSLVDLDALDPSPRPENPGVRQSPDDPAYIYYTSGSTGVPKGVVDAHRNVLHNVMRYTNNLKIGEDDRLTLLQSVAFSGAVSSLFSALLNGAACFPIDLREEGSEGLGAWLAEQQVTIYHSVPSIFQRLLATGRALPSLRIIRLEGDQAAPRHVELFKQHFGPAVTLVNGLGATETGISHQFPIRLDTVITGSVVPVGYATSDLQGLILDAAGAELPPGNVGEIAIKSRFLATGYWRQPELTAARFRPDPAGGAERIYRTGDLGRKGPDGCLEYLGRLDHSRKLHGRWIDGPAVELALTRLESVREAAVIVRETKSGEPELVAYVVATGPTAPTVSALRRALAAEPGEIAVPSRYVLLPELPLDANGKVNRQALPEPDPGRPDLANPFIPPTTATEQTLAQIWAQVLKVDRIGLNDDFSELGGDSLQAIEIAVEIEKRFGTKLPASFLMEAPCIGEMARRLARPDSGSSHLVAIQPAGSRRPFFCMHDEFGDVIAYRVLARLLGPDQPVFGLRARGLDGKEVPFDRVEDMAALYVAEIRKMQPTGPYRLGGNCFGGVVAFEVAQQLKAAGEKVDFLALLDTSFPTGRIRNRVGWHLHRLARKSVSEVLIHLAQLTGRSSKRIALKLRGVLRPFRPQNAAEIVSASDRILAANNRAMSRYRAKSNDRPVVLFCIGQPHNHLGWRKVIRPNLRIASLPESGTEADNGHIVQPPHVGQLAAALRQGLPETNASSG